jgi:hypothetical protein
MKKDDQFLN